VTQLALVLEADPVRAALLRLRAQVEAECGGPSPLYDKFARFHAENPHVLQLLLTYAEQLERAGRRRYGIASLFERIRWHVAVETHDPATDWKLNNSHRAYYARLLVLLRPSLDAVIERRQLAPGRTRNGEARATA
jgi:hypothetical protein